MSVLLLRRWLFLVAAFVLPWALGAGLGDRSSQHGEAAVCLTGFPGGVCSAEDAVEAFEALFAPFHSADIFVVVPGTACSQVRSLFGPDTWRSAWRARFPDRDVQTLMIDCGGDDADDTLKEHEARLAAVLREFAGHEVAELAGASFEDQGAHMSGLLQLQDWLRCGRLVTDAIARGAEYRWMVKARTDSLYYAFLSRQMLLDIMPREVWTAFLPMPHHFQGLQDGCFAGSTDAILLLMRFPAWLKELASSSVALRQEFLSMAPFCAVWPEGTQKANCRVLFTFQYLLDYYASLSNPELQFRSYRGICFEKTMPLPPEGGKQQCLRSRQPLCAHYRPLTDSEAAPRRGGEGFTADHTEWALRGDLDYDPVFAAHLVVTMTQNLPAGQQLTVLHVGCGRCDMVGHLARWPMLAAMGSDASPMAMHLQHSRAMHREWPHPLAFDGRAEDYFVCGLDLEASDPFHVGVDGTLTSSLAELCLLRGTCVGYRRTQGGNLELLIGSAWAKPGTGIGDGTGCLRGSFPEGAWHHNVSHRWDSGQADWVVALDIGGGLAGAGPGSQREASYLEGLARSARRGLVLSWGRPAGHVPGEPVLSTRAEPRTQWAPARTSEELADYFSARGFELDELGTASLRLFSGLVCCRHRQRDVLVLRRRSPPAQVPCDAQLLEPLTLHAECRLGSNFGCVDERYIWVAFGCSGVFARGEVGAATVCMSLGIGHRTECALPSPPSGSTAATAPEGLPQSPACSSAAVDAALSDRRLTRAMAADSARSAHDAMDLLAPRGGLVWEGDCHLNMMTYQLLSHAFAPAFRFRDPFAAAALSRGMSFVLGGDSWHNDTPAQWRRLTVALQLLLVRQDRESVTPRAFASELLRKIEKRADFTGMDRASILEEAGLQLHLQGAVVPARASLLGLYLHRVTARVH